ncbi:MAG TPA: glutamate synthase central domain-containing protein, partial [Vicinamibacteria bacterium]|nr:glutamate synthase central domain-containing protein [Vicinamibacteria bacterium]
RLGPGDVMAVNLKAGRLLDRDAVHRSLAARRPYGRWLRAHRVELEQVRREAGGASAPEAGGAGLALLRAFGYTREDLGFVLGPGHGGSVGPLASIRDDTALAVLSKQPRLLYSYFRPRVAQVTSPPLDPLREPEGTSLAVHLGPKGNLLAEPPEHADQVRLPGPFLRDEDMAALRAWDRPGWQARTLGLLFPTAGGEVAFRRALDELLREAARAAEGGAALLVLSDRGVDDAHAALPMLLAVATVHQHLLGAGLRHRVSLVAETGEARDDHHLACLLAFGASAVNPWLALAAAREAAARYLAALDDGLRRILARTGVSVLSSYQGAQLFEALGVAPELVQRSFTGTPSAIGGVGLGQIAADVLARHSAAFDLPGPRVIDAPRAAVATADHLRHGGHAELGGRRDPVVLRDLLELRPAEAIPLEEVEPVEAIFERFMTAALPVGLSSAEAREVLSAAMNRIGGRSTGDGETAESLWRVLPGGGRAGSRIKQVTPARAGVTAEYLAAADEIQIEMARGGAHRDVHGIEDLAQLVYDLKRVNPGAAVSVRLASQAGIGSLAAGIAKAHAGAIVIGGGDGGPGSSPPGPVGGAGPWELGLAEVQQVLVRGGLRGRLRLQVEGGLETGRDVVVAALLGADEFGFGTAALAAAGCVKARRPRPDALAGGLGPRQPDDPPLEFDGTPDQLVRFFTGVAGEVRGILARLGQRRLQDVIGRTDLLESRVARPGGRAAAVSLSRLLLGSGPEAGAVRHESGAGGGEPPLTGQHLDELVLGRLRFHPDGVRPLELALPIGNADRAVGARIAGELARRFRGRPLEPGTIRLRFSGAAGQGFGAFCVDGLHLSLEGEANDSVGKGMSGGEIAVLPSRPFAPRAGGQVIAGDSILFGATGGRAFVAGRVGDRFAVRNRGALAVVEGVGDHACEHMAAGAVVVLGPFGRNLGAGMSGGLAYVLDPEELLARRASPEAV